MADKGWIKLNRQIMDHWVYQDKPFNRSMAWIDLLLLADHKTHKSLWRGRLTEFKRGDVNLSMTELGRRWGWSRKKVKNFINDLESDRMVALKGTVYRTVITIVKYDDFQVQGTVEGTVEEQQKNNRRTSEGTYLKNNKELNKNNKKVPSTQFHNIEQHNYDFDELEKKLTGE